MKQVILIIGLLFSFAMVNAQVAYTPTVEKPTNEQKAHNQAMRMQKGLALTAEQTVKAEAIQLSRIQGVAAIKNDATKAENIKQSEIQAVNDAKDKELSEIMSAEQFATFVKNRNEIKARQQQAQHAH